MDEYKHLLFNPKLTKTDLVTNAGTCLLCRPGLCITISHGKDHMKKSKRIDGMVLNGCRKDTSFCHVEENKPTRYHYHCPICLYNNKEVGRLFLHINKCKSDPTLNRGCSRDRPTTSPAEDGSATGVHKPFMVRKGKSGSAVPLHVERSTSPGDYKAICHEISCRNAINVALNNDWVSYLCEHLRSTDGAVLSTKEPFDLDLLTTMNFSDKLKEKIVKRFDTSF